MKNLRPLEIGEKVFVYRNLTRDCLSVKSMKTGLVIGHVKEISLRDVTFKVSQKGNERVRREQKKYVHAGVVGYITESVEKFGGVKVRYNPYENKSFVNPYGSPVEKSDFAIVKTSGVEI